MIASYSKYYPSRITILKITFTRVNLVKYKDKMYTEYNHLLQRCT